MGIIKSAADLVYTFRFLKLLVTPFDETPAFKAGIKLVEALKEQGLDLSNMIIEDNQWFMLENEQLSPGIYRVKNNKVLNGSLEEMVKPFDKIRIGEDTFPVGNIFGLNIYEALHIPTKQRIYITSEELLK